MYPNRAQRKEILGWLRVSIIGKFHSLRRPFHLFPIALCSEATSRSIESRGIARIFGHRKSNYYWSLYLDLRLLLVLLLVNGSHPFTFSFLNIYALGSIEEQVCNHLATSNASLSAVQVACPTVFGFDRKFSFVSICEPRCRRRTMDP